MLIWLGVMVTWLELVSDLERGKRETILRLLDKGGSCMDSIAAAWIYSEDRG